VRKTNRGLELPDDTWRIYPIFHFDAPWEHQRIGHLALDVRLIPADDSCLRQLKEHCDESLVSDSKNWFFDPEHGIVHWLLALRVPEGIDHVPVQDIGFSFTERVEDAIATSFLVCLKVLHSTPAICPISFFGQVRGAAIELLGHPPWEFHTTGYAPRCDWPEEFTEDDLRLLRDLWSGMVNLRKLDTWMTAPFQELFFQRLSNAAKEKAERETRSYFERRLSGIPANEREKARDIEKALIKRICEDTGGDSPYGEALRSLFNEEEQKAFNIGTRIGRAVGIFEEGVHLPHLHAFLSVCLVLETLFTLGAGEVNHKLATRLAKVLVDKGTADDRKKLFKKAKDVYTARSNVVHGKTAITDVSEEARKGAFNLTRLALQKILAERRYLDLYTAPTDNDGKGQLSEFFESLDLG
jgi:hypothetical protein